MPQTCDTINSTAAKKAPITPMHQSTVPTSRLFIAWTVLLGGLAGFWCVRGYFTPLDWVNGSFGLLFITSKFATLVCMPPRDLRRLPWGRFVAYLSWPGMQPRHFLPEHTPADTHPAPTIRGMLINVATAGVFLWIVPRLMPADAPQFLRVVSGMIGQTFLLLFAIFDACALLYRACGIGVEKLWHCPLAATSLMDFWGQRWNRIFSGMLREVLFLPLARRLGAGVALFAVFLYSGLAHENFSVGAGSGYGLPLLYFVIQGIGTWLERWPAFRRAVQRWPWLGRLWTVVIVLGPVTLLFHQGVREQLCVPGLATWSVPGLKDH
jgi:alginate O-acetyltransferase complex protein AlgI